MYFDGELFVTYPPYNPDINGWKVTAYPDGRIFNHGDNKEYSYLFWDGNSNNIKFDLTKGFVVKGEDTMEFLQNILFKIGLTPKEYNEFIVYWLPYMQKNKYNFISFAGREYTDKAVLKISPEPDAVLRVFMVFKALEGEISVEKQEFTPFVRKGFTVVEWGGSELR